MKSSLEESLETRSLMVEYLNSKTDFKKWCNYEFLDDVELAKVYNDVRKDKLEIDC